MFPTPNLKAFHVLRSFVLLFAVLSGYLRSVCANDCPVLCCRRGVAEHPAEAELSADQPRPAGPRGGCRRTGAVCRQSGSFSLGFLANFANFAKTKIAVRNIVQNRKASDILYYCQKCPLAPSLISHHSPQSVRLVFVEQRLLPSFSGIIARIALLSVATANCYQ